MTNEKQEYILCAANWYDDQKKYVHQPKNIETGFVICGRRHHNIINTLGQVYGHKDKNFDRDKREQGFITSLDRFVSREEASKIAFDAKQIKNLKKTLYSEDLY